MTKVVVVVKGGVVQEVLSDGEDVKVLVLNREPAAGKEYLLADVLGVPSGRVHGNVRSSCASSRPSMPGIVISIRATSGVNDSTIRSASGPFCARFTS